MIFWEDYPEENKDDFNVWLELSKLPLAMCKHLGWCSLNIHSGEYADKSAVEQPDEHPDSYAERRYSLELLFESELFESELATN